MKWFSPLLILFSLVFACNEPAATDAAADDQKRDTVDYKAAIEEQNKVFEDAVLKGDSAAIANLYHSNANVYPPNMERIDGKGMASMSAGMTKMGVKKFNLDTKELFEGDEVVTEVGTYEMADDNKTLEKGKYVVIWKEEDGKMKLFRDIWNADNPPAPPAKK